MIKCSKVIVTDAQLTKRILKTIKLYTLNWWDLCYANYISIKAAKIDNNKKKK